MMKMIVGRFACLVFVLSMLLQGVVGQKAAEAYGEPSSRLRGEIERFAQDVGAFNRFWASELSKARIARFSELYTDELATLAKMNFDALSHDEQVDYILFKNYLEHEQREMSRFKVQMDEMAALIPFARVVTDLEDARRRSILPMRQSRRLY